MSVTIAGSAGGPIDIDKATAAFRHFVRALDRATVEGGAPFVATFAGAEGSGGFSLTAAEARILDSDAERSAVAQEEFEARAAAEA